MQRRRWRAALGAVTAVAWVVGVVPAAAAAADVDPQRFDNLQVDVTGDTLTVSGSVTLTGGLVTMADPQGDTLADPFDGTSADLTASSAQALIRPEGSVVRLALTFPSAASPAHYRWQPLSTDDGVFQPDYSTEVAAIPGLDGAEASFRLEWCARPWLVLGLNRGFVCIAVEELAGRVAQGKMEVDLPIHLLRVLWPATAYSLGWFSSWGVSKVGVATAGSPSSLSTTQDYDWAAGPNVRFMPQGSVSVASAADPSRSVAAGLLIDPRNGSFEAALDLSGLPPGEHVVALEACLGLDACAESSTQVSYPEGA